MMMMVMILFSKKSQSLIAQFPRPLFPLTYAKSLNPALSTKLTFPRH